MSALNIRALLTGTARRVAHVTRFSGTPLLRPENVAEHSYMTAQYSLFIAKAIHDADPSTTIDLGALLSSAIVHDMDECLLGDLPRPVKYSNPAVLQGWQDMAYDAIGAVEKDLGVEFATEWNSAKRHDSIEGNLLALADMISVTGYVIEELRLGNTYMVPVLAQSLSYLQELRGKRGRYQHPLITQFCDDAIRVSSDTLTQYTP